MLILTREQVLSVLRLKDCIDAVEKAFRMYQEGRLFGAGVLSIHVPDGAFHTKGAGLELNRPYVAVKTNGNFPQNRQLKNLPTIQGAILLCDGSDGRVLALLDSIEITSLRTAAATAVAAKYLARSDSHIAAICGCGVQGRVQLSALKTVLPIETVFAFDVDPQSASAFAKDMSVETGVQIEPVLNVSDATLRSDVIVTCTTSTIPFLGRDDVKPGAFIAAVGADNPAKSEIKPDLYASAMTVTDISQQCAEIGDLKHAIASGIVRADQVYAELGEIITGKKASRTSPDQIFLFDSTGSAIQDVATAAIAYERAMQSEIGIKVDL